MNLPFWTRSLWGREAKASVWDSWPYAAFPITWLLWDDPSWLNFALLSELRVQTTLWDNTHMEKLKPISKFTDNGTPWTGEQAEGKSWFVLFSFLNKALSFCGLLHKICLLLHLRGAYVILLCGSLCFTYITGTTQNKMSEWQDEASTTQTGNEIYISTKTTTILLYKVKIILKNIKCSI